MRDPPSDSGFVQTTVAFEVSQSMTRGCPGGSGTVKGNLAVIGSSA